MTIHTLEKEKHNNFLAQNRIDPITGDLLQENDEIVICANCKSAFLIDSWEYMNQQHCNQSLTLKNIPVNEVVRMEKAAFINLLEIKTYSNFDAAYKAAAPYSLTGFASFFIAHWLGFIQLNTINLAHFVSWFFVLVFYVSSPYKKLVRIKNNVLLFSETDLEIRDIISIEIEKPRRFFITNTIGKLYKKKRDLFKLKIIDRWNLTHNILMNTSELERINNETNLLQKFVKNPFPLLSVNQKIEKKIINQAD